MMKIFKFKEIKIIFDVDSFNFLKEKLKNNKIKNIFFISSKSLKKRIKPNFIKKIFNNKKFFWHSSISSNPKIQEINKAIFLAKKFKPDLIVAMGGGSVMDTAKIISVLIKQKNKLTDYLFKKKELQPQKISCWLIPTTIGTGSEVTPFSVIYGKKQKYSLDNPIIQAELAIIDPSLSLSLPCEIMISGMIDSFSQAIESFWAVKSTEESCRYAVKSIKLIKEFLLKAIKDNKNLFFRRKLALASLESGKAISLTRTTASHAVAYPLTIFYKVPHGLACGLTLPSFLEFNAQVCDKDCLDKRGPKFVKNKIDFLVKILGQKSASQAKNYLTNFFKKLGAPVNLKELGLSDKLSNIVRYSFNQSRLSNNPRLVTKDNLIKLLKNIC